MNDWADDTMTAMAMNPHVTEKLAALMRLVDRHPVTSPIESLRTKVLKVSFLENEDGRG